MESSENRESWQRFFAFVFSEEPKNSGKEPCGMAQTAIANPITQNTQQIAHVSHGNIQTTLKGGAVAQD